MAEVTSGLTRSADPRSASPEPAVARCPTLTRKSFSRPTWHACVPILVALTLLTGQPPAAAAPAEDAPHIRNVRVFPRDPRPERGEQVIIAFRTDQPAAGALSLYGRDGMLVRELRFDNPGDTAPRRLLWDCTDMDGNAVPAEAYTLRIEVRDRNGREAIYDPAHLSGGEILEAADLRYLPESEQFAYRIDRDARVSIRSGIDRGGPLLRTLVDWRPRLAGEQREPWDGLDPDGRVRVVDLPGHLIEVQAVALPDHAIIVQRDEGSTWEAYSAGLAGERPTRPTQAHGASTRTLMSTIQPRFDPRPHFALSIPSPAAYRRGVPVVAGRVGIRVALDDAVKRQIIEQRFEVVLFVDTRFETETEEGYSPSTLVWDSTGHPDGEHLLTVNLVTLSGRTATASLPVITANLERPDAVGADPSQ